MRGFFSRRIRLGGWLLLAGSLSVLTGCGLFVTVAHAVWGDWVEAEYAGLNGRRVAVVCVSQSGSFGPDSSARLLAEQVEQLLHDNLSRRTVIVDQQNIQEWIDNHDWNHRDFRRVGAGVDAELVVAINLDTFGVRDGPNLFKGVAEVEVMVYDVSRRSRPEYRTGKFEVRFPAVGVEHASDTTEGRFRRKFVKVLGRQIARRFFRYERVREDRFNIAVEGK